MADKEKTKVKDSNGTFGELKFMVTDYAKQQTVEPLKNLGKWAGLGVAGGVMLIIGAFLTGLGFLRLFQKWSIMTKDCDIGGIASTCDTGWTALPYFFVVLMLAVTLVVLGLAAKKTPEWLEDDA